MARLFALREGTTEDYIPVVCNASGELEIALKSDTSQITNAWAASGIVPDTSGEVAFSPGASKTVYLRNTHASNSMDVSFDDMTSWLTLAALVSIQVDIARDSVHLRNSVSGTSATYQALVGY